jgi:hypothetical protein
MLVIADQVAFGIRRERRFTGTAQPEQQMNGPSLCLPWPNIISRLSRLTSTLVVDPMPRGQAVGRKRAGIVDGEIRFTELPKIHLCRQDERCMHEQRDMGANK